jgi:hypothetical protein
VGWLGAAGFAVAALAAAPSYGLAFDSHIWFPFGDDILAWLGGVGRYPLNLYSEPFEAYGSAAALAAAATNALLAGVVDPIVGHHVAVVLCGAALVGLTAWLGAHVGGPATGVAAALLLATAPRFFFEAETNASDVPAALAWSVVLVALLRALETQRTAPLLVTALAAALLGAVRLTNLLFLPAVPLLWLACSAVTRRQAWGLVARGGWWRLPLAAALLAGGFVAFRPLAWPAPWATVQTILDRLWVPPYWTSKGVADLFYRGALVAGGPPSFHPVMLAITTPLPFLLALGPGLAVLFRRQRHVAWLLVAWVTVAVGRHAFLERGNYDGIRHVLDALPALAVVAGAGVSGVLAWLAAGVARRLRPAVWALGTIVVASPGFVAIVRLHPYQVAYYNVLVGGLAGAAGRFETEYSGVAYREALLWASRELGPDDRLWLTRDYDRRLVEQEARWLGLAGIRTWQPGGAEPATAPRRLVTMQILRPGPAERPAGAVPAAALPVVYEIRRDGVVLLRAREVPPALRGEIVRAGA